MEFDLTEIHVKSEDEFRQLIEQINTDIEFANYFQKDKPTEDLLDMKYLVGRYRALVAKENRRIFREKHDCQYCFYFESKRCKASKKCPLDELEKRKNRAVILPELHYREINHGKDCVEFMVSEGFDYTKAIKTSLRQNPKWLMLSEARSVEVKYLLESLSTGVRGFTTLHTDDVRKIPDRILNMLANRMDADRMENDVYMFLDVGILIGPFMLLQTMQGKYHTTMFSLANNYMEQFLYSFKRTGTVLSALTETAEVFGGGAFHDVLEEAISHIRFETDSADIEKDALAMVGQFFHCERVDAVHAFAIGAQRRGGDADGSITLLNKNRSMWADRISSLQKEFSNVKRNIVFALAATLAICVLPLYLLGGELDISVLPICQVSAVILIAVCMFIYTKADKKLCRSWIEKEQDTSGMKIKYIQVRDFDEAKEGKKSLLMAMIPVLLFGMAFAVFQKPAILVIGLGVVLFFSKQHKIGQSLAKKKVAREITKQFSEWLMQVALLLQTDNVQMLKGKSIMNIQIFGTGKCFDTKKAMRRTA